MYNNKKLIRMEKNSELSVLEVIDHLIDVYSTQKREKNGQVVEGSLNSEDYRVLKNSLEKFVLETYKKYLSAYSFSHINPAFLLDYATFLEKQGLKTKTKGALPNRLKKLQAVLNYARNKEIAYTDPSVFNCVKSKMKIEKSVPVIVPSEIIHRIETIDRSKFTKTEQFHIDLFLFSFYSGGMSCSDMAYLSMNNIDNDILIYEKMRVCKIVKVDLILESRIIMLAYRNRCHDHYALPILLRKHESEKQKRERIERLSLDTNKTLVKVCKEIRYKEKIKLNSSQAAYINRTLKAGIDPFYIVQSTGCSFGYLRKHFL